MSLCPLDTPDCEAIVAAWVKSAATAPTNATVLAGTLYKSDSGWILLSVPNGLVRGLFAAMHEPGISLPLDSEGQLNAHISVIRPEELEQIGGAEKINERGKQFYYQLGPMQTVVPHGWEGMSRVWFVSIKSPALERLRKSYGLTPLPKNNEFAFHLTVCVRRKGILYANDTSKAASLEGCHEGLNRECDTAQQAAGHRADSDRAVSKTSGADDVLGSLEASRKVRNGKPGGAGPCKTAAGPHYVPGGEDRAELSGLGRRDDSACHAQGIAAAGDSCGGVVSQGDSDCGEAAGCRNKTAAAEDSGPDGGACTVVGTAAQPAGENRAGELHHGVVVKTAGHGRFVGSCGHVVEQCRCKERHEDTPVPVLCAKCLQACADETEPSPSDAQKASGNYKKGRCKWYGLELVFENAKGSTRSGTDKDGNAWSIKMKDAYGYIRGTKSEADQDHVDIFLCDEALNSGKVFVVNQHVDGKWDEHKVVAGVGSEAHAREVYLRNYAKDWDGLHSIKEMTIPEFKEWLESGDTSKKAEDGSQLPGEKLKDLRDGRPNANPEPPKPTELNNTRQPAPEKVASGPVTRALFGGRTSV